MKNNNLHIPEHELEITTSRSGGPGGQHVNKTNTKIIIRWNINKTSALNDEQKQRILQNLQNTLTTEGDLIIINNSTRSQLQNKKLAIEQLYKKMRKALFIPKKREKTKVPKIIKERILEEKKYRGKIKKLRTKKNFDY